MSERPLSTLKNFLAKRGRVKAVSRGGGDLGVETPPSTETFFNLLGLKNPKTHPKFWC